MYDQTPIGSEHEVPRGLVRASVAYAGSPQTEQTLLKELWRAVRRRLGLIVLVALAFVGAAVGFSIYQTPVYAADVKILVGQEAGEDQQGSLSGSVQGLQQLTQTMVEAINSRPVAEAVISKLGLRMSPGDLLGNLTVEQIGTTQFIRLYYEDSDPKRAQSVANALADVSSERIAHASASANKITATVWERATVPKEPVSPDPLRNGLVALALGLMLGVGSALLLEYLEDGWRSPEEIEQTSGIPALGFIPEFEATKGE